MSNRKSIGLKVFLTLMIWGFAMGPTQSAIDMIDYRAPELTSEIMPMAVMAVMAGIFGTILIWGIPEFIKLYNFRVASQGLEETGSQEKAKRDGHSGHSEKLSLLLELMDEDEREAFKEMLRQQVLRESDDYDSVDDGELPAAAATLAALLDDDSYNQSLR